MYRASCGAFWWYVTVRYLLECDTQKDNIQHCTTKDTMHKISAINYDNAYRADITRSMALLQWWWTQSNYAKEIDFTHLSVTIWQCKRKWWISAISCGKQGHIGMGSWTPINQQHIWWRDLPNIFISFIWRQPACFNGQIQEGPGLKISKDQKFISRRNFGRVWSAL